MRAAVRPRSATFIHFYVDPPLTRAIQKESRWCAFGLNVFKYIHRFSRVRCRLCMHVYTRFDLARWRHLIRICLSACISSTALCHASRPLINFITRPNPHGKGLSTRETCVATRTILCRTTFDSGYHSFSNSFKYF